MAGGDPGATETNGSDDGTAEANAPPPAYFGVGCLTAVAGFAGGGMIAVLVAKIVGALTRCAADTETGAPCGWGTYWLRGALLGMVLLPAASLWRLWRGRHPHNSERG